MRLFEDLQREGYQGAYDSLVRHVRVFQQSPSRPSDAYIPLSFDPGEAYQFDWSHEIVNLGGITHKIKVIKRMAYGFRDGDYFFLKIRAAFPGNR